ncbi:MAG: hypothetical protein F6K39_10580 [Okeania sp. SIO3B3]|nr:hypothetical protein [Okeania sp. SIO3B3]
MYNSFEMELQQRSSPSRNRKIKKPQRYSYGIDVLFLCCTIVLRWSYNSDRLPPEIDKSKKLQRYSF